MKLFKQLMFVLIAVQSMFSATGCSILGMGIGAIKDTKEIEKIKKYGVPDDRTASLSLKENHPIQIFLKNGERQEGLFVKLMNQKVGEDSQASIVWHDMSTGQQVSTPYKDIKRIITIQYEQDKWRVLEEAETIKGSSRIEISLKDGQLLQGRFLKQMEEQVGNGNLTTIEWYDVANKQQMSTQVEDIEGIIAFENERDNWVGLEEAATIKGNSHIEIFLKDGQILQGRFLKQLEQQVGIETVQTIVWYDEANTRQVSTHVADIAGIVVKQKRNQKWKGLGIGIVIDAVLTAVILKNGLELDIISLNGLSFDIAFGF